MHHIKYLWYVLKHKYYVFYAGCRLGGIPIYRLVIHDWTKFTREEWTPYARRFFGDMRKGKEFDDAWNHHWINNLHHPQVWIRDHNGIMPRAYIREMIADWYGAGMAQGKPDILGWCKQSTPGIQLHKDTMTEVWSTINEAIDKGIY